MEFDPMPLLVAIKESRTCGMSFCCTYIILQRRLQLIIHDSPVGGKQDALVQEVRDFFEQCDSNYDHHGIISPYTR
ncbi:hypothetical protein TNCT_232441 [Trichonephila clavata]|uniref:Uncharacterized protein n=1 Tax=Trichonephila clavata TaxID=2740835 RepID=A0A8X6LBW2_TRICU|nr:hypothetical protein TNCT_232441 [Trichonephila clavata]